MSEPRSSSYYTASINQETDYSELVEDIRVDVAIVGGGFTGINTALDFDTVSLIALEF